ncbi:ribonuclease HII [Fusobacterium sp. CAG:439]|nr:ribonuclease HII [Fusobacterium sp. CAG:439]HIT92649.1 ribonuclease HII [Candidatus Stercorousia faecigallinarum]
MVQKLKTTLTADSRIIQLFTFDLNQKRVVIGTDEAGRGCGAGGVFASAVCFNKRSQELVEQLEDLNDSKKLSPKKREALYDIIKENTVNSTVCIEVDEIERINILNASLKAMRMACENVINQLYPIPEEKDKLIARNMLSRSEIMILIDGNKRIWDFDYSQRYVVKGDARSASIAAASILAKVSRDRYMLRLDKEFPQYNWKDNAGYLTKEHMALIDKYGMCKYHRPSYLQKHFAKQEQLSLF